jgi:integrase
MSSFDCKSFSFTESRIEEVVALVRSRRIEAGADGRRKWRDEGCPHGLYLRVGRQGAAFYRVAKVAGKKLEQRIGDATAMSLKKAREAALKLAGGDQSAAAAPIRIRSDGPTVDEVWNRYIEAASTGEFVAGRRQTAASTLTSYGFLYRPHIKPKYGNRSLHALAADVHALHRKLRGTPVAANRLLQVCSNLFVFAARNGLWNKPNPTLDPITGRTIRKHHVKSRSRYLTTAEAARVLEYAATERNPWRDFWRVMILTGIRVSNVREMKWSQLDLRAAGATWAIPLTKNGQPHESPLSIDAAEILRERLRLVPKGKGVRKGLPESEWVFPMRGDPSKCISDVDHAWARVRKAADIKDVRVHDLRRTAASWATQAGAPITAVGQYIGDKSVNATAVYARSNTAQARQVSEIVAERLREAAGGATNA